MIKTSGFLRKICACGFASLLAQCVWAVEPLAVWNGFSNLTGAEGYTLTAGEGVVGEDGVATIADGKILLLDKNLGTAFTVVMEVSDIPGNSSNFTTLIDWRYSDNSSHLSVDTKDSRLRHIWNNGDNTSWGQSAFYKTPIGRNVIAIAYSYPNGGEKTYVNGVEVVTGGAYSRNAATKLGIGGYVNDTPTQCAVGMKVYRLAIYNSQLSAEDVAAVSKTETALGASYTWSNLAHAEGKTWFYTRASGAFSVNIPATADVPAGTMVAISKLKFGTKESGNNWSTSMTVNGVTSSSVTTEDNEYDETYNKLKVYTFNTPFLVEVGKAYTVTTAGSSSQFTGIKCDSPIDIAVGNNGRTYCAVEGVVLHEANIGDVKYNTVAAAIEAVGENETTITLVSDSAGAIEIPSNITIDTNGKTLSGTITGSGIIKINELAENTPRFNFGDDWIGTVEIAALAQGTKRTKLMSWGTANSKIVFNGLTGDTIWVGANDNTIAPTIRIDGPVVIDSGSSTASYTLNTVTGSGNLTLASWGGCRNGNPYGVTYTIDTLSDYTGTLALENRSTYESGGAFKFAIGNIVKTSAPAYGEKILSLTRTCTSTNQQLDYDVSSTKLNGETAPLVLKDDGVYLASVKIGETPYATLADAIAALGEGQDPTAITLIDTSITDLPEGCEDYKIIDGVIVAKTYVAQIGTDGKKYETLQAAIDAAEDGDTVYLIADATETVLNEFADITLHINEGVTLTGKEWYTVFNWRHTLTIEGEGTIKGVASSPYHIIALYNQEGTMYINGCTIVAKNYDIYEVNPVKTEVTGGRFNLTPGPWLASGYTTNKSPDGLYYLVEALTYIAKIGEKTYATLQEALNEVEENQMIELACSTTEEVKFDKDFVVVIKNNTYNYGTIIGAKGLYESWTAQYSFTAEYVVLSKSMEDLIAHVAAKDATVYKGRAGRFYIYDDWTLYKDVTIPTVSDLSVSVFPVQDTFVLDLNGYTLEQAAVVNSHGGYPTIVADKGRKVTIKDSSEAKEGILCGIGWAVDIYDDPNTCVTLESGTITTHGAVNKNATDMRGCVVRLQGGKFVMNGGAISLAHLPEGNQLFGVIITTKSSGYASAPTIEINGGYVQCATPEQLWDPDGTRNPNCLILEAKIDNEHKQEGEAKQMLPEIAVSGGSFSIVPPKTYFAEGLDAVVDENGHFLIQQVVHEGEEVTIAVSGDGEKLAPTVPEEGSVKIFASAEEGEKQVYVIDIAEQETPAALYRIVTTDAEGTESTSNVGVIKVEEKSLEKKTIAVAVPFTGATVENLVNTKLLNEGDELKAYVNGAYAMWTLGENGKWISAPTVKAGGTETAPNAETTPLKRGTAVWVTTAGQVVTLGTFDADEDVVAAEETVNLLGNPTMTALEPAAKRVGDSVVLMDNTRYTSYGTEANKVWITQQADENDPTVVRPVEQNPSVGVGKGYWMIRK